MDPERTDAEALRRRLYRPGASEEDLTSYLDRAGPDVPIAVATVPDRVPTAGPLHPDRGTGSDPEQQPGRPGGGRGRSLLIAAAVGAVAVLAGAAVAVGGLAPGPEPTPTPSSSVSVWAAAPRDPGDAMVATAVLDGGRRVHATGQAKSLEQGYLYTVGTDDTVFGIADRFGLCTADVLTALPYGADADRLPEGERLVLTHGFGAPATARSRGTC